MSFALPFLPHGIKKRFDVEQKKYLFFRKSSPQSLLLVSLQLSLFLPVGKIKPTSSISPVSS